MKYSGIIPGLLVILAALALGAVLQATSSVIMPLVIALLLSFVLSPLVETLVRTHVPRIAAIIIVILGLLGVGVLIGRILYTSINSLVQSWSIYQGRVLGLYAQVTNLLHLPSNILSQPNVTRSIGGYAVNFFGDFLKFMGSLTLVIIFVLFLLLEKPFLRAKLIDAIEGPKTETVVRVLHQVTEQVGRYLTIKLLVSAAVGLTIWLSFGVIGIDFAFVWGVLSFLFNFVPAFGSLAVGLVGVLFAVTQYLPNWTPIIEAGIAVAAVQILFGSILEPLLQGDNLNLSPVVLLFSLLIWGWLWGLMGMLLSVPLTVALKIALGSIPRTRFVSVLMGTGNSREHSGSSREQTGGS